MFMARLKEALNFTGNYKEKLAHIFCHMLKIPFDKLTDEEISTMGKILDLSPVLKTAFSQRGKGQVKTEKTSVKSHVGYAKTRLAAIRRSSPMTNSSSR